MSLRPEPDEPLAANSARQPKRSKSGGLVLIVASPVVAALLLVKAALLAYSQVTNDRVLSRVDLEFLGSAALLVAWYGIKFGRQLRAPDAQEVLRRDQRPPIVFLRPFQEDHHHVHKDPVGEREGGGRSGLLDLFADKINESEVEQRLARLLRHVGPFIAVGKPGESLATVGAARTYLTDDQWKDKVESMVRCAGAVILQPELSSGTLWEVELIARVTDLMRLFLIVPNPALRPLRYMHIRDLVQERFDVMLPTADECPPCDAFYFDDRRNPIPLGIGQDATLARDARPFLDRLASMKNSGRPDGHE
jgi:hypothetical protein